MQWIHRRDEVDVKNGLQVDCIGDQRMHKRDCDGCIRWMHLDA